MNEIELNCTDLSTLLSPWPVHVESSCIVIFGPKGIAIAQPGWTLIELSDDDMKNLMAGLKIVNRNYIITPPIPAYAFIGYKGAKFFDTSYIGTSIHPPFEIEKMNKGKNE